MKAIEGEFWDAARSMLGDPGSQKRGIPAGRRRTAVEFLFEDFSFVCIEFFIEFTGPVRGSPVVPLRGSWPPRTLRNGEGGVMSDKIGQILVTKKIITESSLAKALDIKKKEPDRYLGQILCDMGIPQSRVVKALRYSNKRKPIGQIFVDLNLVTEDQLQGILLQQKSLKARKVFKPLGSLLADSRLIGEEHHMKALSAHFCMPVVSLKGFTVSPALQKAVGERYAKKNRIVVLDDSPLVVTVAIAEPDPLVIETLERAMPEGKYVMFCIARVSEIENCLDEKYDPYRYSRPYSGRPVAM